MIKVFIMLLSCMFLFIGCSIEEEKLELPEGYKIMCSVEGNKYSLYMPDMHKIGINVWDTKEEVIAFAIFWEKHKFDEPHITSNEYDWERCE